MDCNYIYIVGSYAKEMLGLYKVGSGNPQKRLKSLQTGCPFKLQVFSSFDIGDRELAFYVEKKVHRLLNDYRVSELGCREWFRCSQEVIVAAVEGLLNKDKIQGGEFMTVSCRRAHAEWKARNGKRSKWGDDNRVWRKG